MRNLLCCRTQSPAALDWRSRQERVFASPTSSWPRRDADHACYALNAHSMLAQEVHVEDSSLLTHYLEGEIVAITALLRAMIETHPNPLQLQLRFEEKYRAALAATTPALGREQYLDGLRSQAGRLWYGYRRVELNTYNNVHHSSPRFNNSRATTIC